MYDGSDNILMRFDYADARVPVAMEAGGSTYYLIPDQVGSIRLVVDISGNIVKKIDYDSFGNILSDSNPTLAIPFGFAGGLYDSDTGLVRFGFRDYDTATGRLILDKRKTGASHNEFRTTGKRQEISLASLYTDERL